MEQAARARKRTLALSPEVALLERGGGVAAAKRLPCRKGRSGGRGDLETLRGGGGVPEVRSGGIADPDGVRRGQSHADLVFGRGRRTRICRSVPFVGRAGGFLTDVIEKGLK